MMDYLDDDIVIEILARFPAKACLRFKCVCRRWRSLISGPAFAETHLRISLQENPSPPERLLIAGASHFLSVKLIEGSDSWQDGPECTLLDIEKAFLGGRSWCVMGSCRGLVCIRKSQCRIFLYNPTTRESRELPRPLHLGKIGSSPVSGLGYDALNDDYKFIIGTSNDVYSPEHKFLVYSLKSDSWRCIGNYNGSYEISSYGNYCQGSLYWISERYCEVQSIISFDVATEKFGEDHLPMPSFTYPAGRTESRVSEAGWLFLLRCYRGKNEVWIIKDGRHLNSTWTKLCCFTSERIDLFMTVCYPLVKDGKIVVFCHKSCGRRVGLYDPEEGSWKTSVLPPAPMSNDQNQVTYVESLVSITRR